MANKTMGRPSKYTPELAEEICDAVASSSDGLRVLCEQNPHWPARHNIFIWIRKHPEFRSLYTRSKQEQSEVLIDHIQELMSEEHHFVDEKGNERIDVGVLRLKVDTIKWQASKLNPKIYGDRQVIEQVTADNEALKVELAELRAKLDDKNKSAY